MGPIEHAQKTLVNLYLFDDLFAPHSSYVDARQFLTNTFGKHTEFDNEQLFRVHSLYVYTG